VSRVIHGVKGCSITMLKGSSNYHDDPSLGIIMMTRIMISSQSTVRYDLVHEADNSMFGHGVMGDNMMLAAWYSTVQHNGIT